MTARWTMVNYGPEPREVAEAVMAKGRAVVRGNHHHAVAHDDAAVVATLPPGAELLFPRRWSTIGRILRTGSV